jgi:hypothetical protein
MANLKPQPKPDDARSVDASLRNPSLNADVNPSLSVDADDPRNPRNASMVARRPRGKDARRREVAREAVRVTSSMLTSETISLCNQLIK